MTTGVSVILKEGSSLLQQGIDQGTQLINQTAGTRIRDQNFHDEQYQTLDDEESPNGKWEKWDDNVVGHSPELRKPELEVDGIVNGVENVKIESDKKVDKVEGVKNTSVEANEGWSNDF